MKPNFHPSLINDPLGDPGLLIQFLYERRALLFDLGDLPSVPNATLLKISHVFVSHTHIDHFVGFDRLLRIVFGRGKTIYLYGPENFIANVEGKLAGFTWNLVDRYTESLTLEVTEVRNEGLKKAQFRAIDKFKRSEVKEEPWNGSVLVDEPSFTLSVAILEHRVPCLGFALKEKFHVNVRKEKLDVLKYSPGPWLNEMKESIFEDRPDDHPIDVRLDGTRRGETKQILLGELKKELVMITPGQKIVYVVDTVFTEDNRKKIVDLARDADIFFCESPFLAEEESRALERRHLTSRQAGLLAREAGVKQLRTFHFSPKHSGRVDQLYREAEEAFQG